MSNEIIAALIGGAFAIIAALIPIYYYVRQKAREEAQKDLFTQSEGLSAVVGIVQRGVQVLMVQRRKRIGQLSWQFPAGIVKPGDDIRDKLEREIFKETAVRCKMKKFLGGRLHEDTKVYLNYMHCDYLEGEAQNLDPQENAQVLWVHACEVHSYVTSSIYGEVDRLLDEIAGGEHTQKVALGIVRSGPDVLVVRRREGSTQFEWRFPGGTVESGETESQAAAREVTEETGVTCSPVRKIGEREHPDTGDIVAYWLCDYVRGEATLREPDKFSEVVWMNSNDVVSTFGEHLFAPLKPYLLAEVE